MDWILFSGLLSLPWWGAVVAALLLTHITIVAVTVFLHRHQAHHALDLHPVVSHFFRFWLWLTTGMVTREWVAVHRKHHAKRETVDDPHSPQILGLNRVLWGGVLLYVAESRKRETILRYGQGAPDDWLERNVYGRLNLLGLTLMGLIDVVLFGIVPGLLILLAQIVWIPFWAAGVINGVGHFSGYRNWPTEDASTNLSPWGILIGGEELHNNHHAFTTSAKLSSKWYEFDIGWMYIRTLELLGLATVRHLAPVPRFAAPKPVPDLQTLRAVITHRYDVRASFDRSLRLAHAEAVDQLRGSSPREARALQDLAPELQRDERMLPEAERRELGEALSKARALEATYAMRRDLVALWEHSTAPKEQLVAQLQDWCRRADSSGVAPLVQFSERLRRYA